MDIMNFLQLVSVSVVPVLLAITAHEAAHAYVAKLAGDDTAYRLGRVTLNPIPHIDVLGTIIIPLLCLAVGGFMFGWAKPVPINPSKMKFPRKSPFWVALAGPFSNFIMAIMWALFALLMMQDFVGSWIADPLFEMAKVGITINLILMIFNLLPIPPLDGGRMTACFLKRQALATWNKIEPYGFFIVLGLSFTGLLATYWITPWMHVFSWIPGIAF